MTLYERGHWLDDDRIQEVFTGEFRRALAPLYRAVMSRLRRLAIRRAYAVFVHGSVLRAECAALNGRVLDVVPLSPVRATDLWLRPAQADAEEETILYVGAVGRKKGLDYLLKACRLLADQGRRFRLRLVLQSPPTPQQQQMLAPIRERATVEVGLKWQDLRERYRTSSVLVVPSTSEGFPRVLYEGMSQSIPIVVSGLPSISAVLGDGVHALLCPPGDARAVASTIERLLSNRELRTSLVGNAFELVSSLLRANAGRSHARQVFEICHSSPGPGSAFTDFRPVPNEQFEDRGQR